jgi:hypothetical protein
MTGWPQQAPGVVGVRLSGDQADADALAGMLAALPGVEILSRSAGRPNRYDPGERVSLPVRVTRPAAPASHAPAGPPAPRPEWLYGSGCCEHWTPEDGCPHHTGRPAMSRQARAGWPGRRGHR